MTNSAREEILCACRLLLQPVGVHEVRALKADTRRTISRYFDSPEAFVNAVLQLDGAVPGGGHVDGQ